MNWWRRRRFGRGPKPIKPLKGSPYENIKKWCYEKSKRMKENPLTGKTRKVKEKEIKIPQLQRTLIALVDRMNEVIHWITQIPILKRRMLDLEEKHERDHKIVTAMIAANTAGDVIHRNTPTPFTHNPFISAGRRFGRYRSNWNTFEEGGRVGRRTKPKPSRMRLNRGNRQINSAIRGRPPVPTNRSRGINPSDLYIPDSDYRDGVRGTVRYDRAGWSYDALDINPMAFLYLIGNIQVEGVDLFEHGCFAPHSWADVNMGYILDVDNSVSDVKINPEICDKDCAQACANEYPDLQHYSKTPSSAPYDYCECYCISYPANCVKGIKSTSGQLFPNITTTSPLVPTGRGDAIGVFYNNTLIGWDFIHNMYFTGNAEGFESQEHYSFNSLPGIIIPMSYNVPQESWNDTDNYPEPGTILNTSNSRIILYKANTNTFHELVGNSPQDIYNTQIEVSPQEVTVIGIDYLDMEWNYDEYGNPVDVANYGDNVLTYTFGPPIQLPQELAPITDAELPNNYCQTDEDCNGRMICINNECKADRPTGQCYCECTGYGEDEYAIQHLYLDNQCFGEVDCANSCGNYCQTLGSYNMTYSQCIDTPSYQTGGTIQVGDIVKDMDST
tara:strand:+ start:724 stop:2565 length:1842 start_codon:yes stop_codon:yes gene_type:complete